MSILSYWFSVLILVRLGGCWDSYSSPEVVNDTHLYHYPVIMSGKKVQHYTILVGGTLLLPNVLTEGGFNSMIIESEEGTKVSRTKKKLVSHIGERDDSLFSLAKLVSKGGI